MSLEAPCVSHRATKKFIHTVFCSEKQYKPEQWITFEIKKERKKEKQSYMVTRNYIESTKSPMISIRDLIQHTPGLEALLLRFVKKRRSEAKNKSTYHSMHCFLPFHWPKA